MRLKARVAAVLAAGTTFMCVAPASAQQTVPTCSDFPTQIDMENSVFPPTLDAFVFDPDDDGVGCEENPGPPVPYDVRVFPPAAISDVRPLEVSPTSGRPGTVITVHGEGCISPRVALVALELFNETTQQRVFTLGSLPEVATDGSWTGQLTVPTGVNPDDTFAVHATCFVDVEAGPAPIVVRYEPVELDVTGAPTAPPAPAAPATPVVGEPTFTG